MQLVMWIIVGAFAAWLARRLLGVRDRGLALLPIFGGALAAAVLGIVSGRAGQPDFASLLRVSTVFVGAIGIFVMASLSTGGRLR